ncbi:hypothetical protein PR048_030621 [Dryococelus australis]|uniref:Uncharacterized protein n=1 Tax=Dryococelus australis TaxID=614101 RepID=A0ABQ9G9G3_9NEOP|nr:hypothetical protein PR048_030621 [Dryococelus australis]
MRRPSGQPCVWGHASYLEFISAFEAEKRGHDRATLPRASSALTRLRARLSNDVRCIKHPLRIRTLDVCKATDKLTGYSLNGANRQGPPSPRRRKSDERQHTSPQIQFAALHHPSNLNDHDRGDGSSHVWRSITGRIAEGRIHLRLCVAQTGLPAYRVELYVGAVISPTKLRLTNSMSGPAANSCIMYKKKRGGGADPANCKGRAHLPCTQDLSYYEVRRSTFSFALSVVLQQSATSLLLSLHCAVSDGAVQTSHMRVDNALVQLLCSPCTRVGCSVQEVGRTSRPCSGSTAANPLLTKSAVQMLSDITREMTSCTVVFKPQPMSNIERRVFEELRQCSPGITPARSRARTLDAWTALRRGIGTHNTPVVPGRCVGSEQARPRHATRASLEARRAIVPLLLIAAECAQQWATSNRFSREVFSPPTKANRVQSPAGFSHVGIMPDDANAAGQRVFSEISRFPRSFIPTLPHSQPGSPSSAFKTWLAVKSRPNLLPTLAVDNPRQKSGWRRAQPTCSLPAQPAPFLISPSLAIASSPSPPHGPATSHQQVPRLQYTLPRPGAVVQLAPLPNARYMRGQLPWITGSSRRACPLFPGRLTILARDLERPPWSILWQEAALSALGTDSLQTNRTRIIYRHFTREARHFSSD